jgi:hypothetical protein
MWFVAKVKAVALITGLMWPVCAFAQQQPQPPSVPPEYVIQACYAMARGEFDNALGSAANSNWNAAKVAQLTAQAADLQKKLAEAEARVPAYPIDPNISD